MHCAQRGSAGLQRRIEYSISCPNRDPFRWLVRAEHIQTSSDAISSTDFVTSICVMIPDNLEHPFLARFGEPHLALAEEIHSQMSCTILCKLMILTFTDSYIITGRSHTPVSGLDEMGGTNTTRSACMHCTVPIT